MTDDTFYINFRQRVDQQIKKFPYEILAMSYSIVKSKLFARIGG